jgi:hypothetical protein
VTGGREQDELGVQHRHGPNGSHDPVPPRRRADSSHTRSRSTSCRSTASSHLRTARRSRISWRNAQYLGVDGGATGGRGPSGPATEDEGTRKTRRDAGLLDGEAMDPPLVR